MSDLKSKLIKLGSRHPDLQSDLEPVIDRLGKEAVDYGPGPGDLSSPPEPSRDEEKLSESFRQVARKIFQNRTGLGIKEIKSPEIRKDREGLKANGRVLLEGDGRDPQDVIRVLQEMHRSSLLRKEVGRVVTQNPKSIREDIMDYREFEYPDLFSKNAQRSYGVEGDIMVRDNDICIELTKYA